MRMIEKVAKGIYDADLAWWASQGRVYAVEPPPWEGASTWTQSHFLAMARAGLEVLKEERWPDMKPDHFSSLAWVGGVGAEVMAGTMVEAVLDEPPS